MRAVSLEDALKTPSEYPCRCFGCKKAPRNCTCFEYRVEKNPNGFINVYADSIATDPVNGEQVGLWQARRNARIFRRPQFIDELLIMSFKDDEVHSTWIKVEDEIKRNTFHIDNYREQENFYIPKYDKLLIKRLPVFRRPRKKRATV